VQRAFTIAPFAILVCACGFFSPSVGSGPISCDGGECGTSPTSDAATVSFANDLRPIMNRLAMDPNGPGCAGCHYESAPNPIGIEQGGLDMTTLGQLRKGGNTSGAMIVIAGEPDQSALVQKLRGIYPYGARMPYNGPPYLTDAEIQLFADWIAQGAVGADDE
jgi:Planctomycete cytochrome C